MRNKLIILSVIIISRLLSIYYFGVTEENYVKSSNEWGVLVSILEKYHMFGFRIIDQEVSALIEEQYKRALETLTTHQDKLILLADKLLKTEVIFKEDLEIIFGKRIWDKDQLLAESSEETIKPKPKRTAKKAIAAPDTTTDPATDSTIDTSSETNE